MNVTDWQTKSDFQELLKKPGPHLVVFAASWCGFCTRFIRQAKALNSNEKLWLIDADNPDESLWDEYSVRIVPTLFVFENGSPTFRRDGISGAGLGMADLEQGISNVLKVS